MKPFFAHLAALSLSASIMFGSAGPSVAETRYDGVTLNLASQNDQFAAVLAGVAPKFEELTGAKVNVDILSSWRSKSAKHRGRETLTAIGDQAFLDFQQRHVRPAANETEQIVAMGLYTTRTTISPRRSRRDLALGFEARHPAHGAGDADPKTLGCRVARHATFHHRPHNPFAKIVGKRHPRRLLRTATIFKQIKADSGIPPTIQFARRPL